MRMTEKQKRFCDFYIETGNATQAAIKAGYSEKTAKQIGQENLTKPDLRAYIDKRLEEMENKRTADAQEVLEYLTAVMRGEETEEILIGIGEGAQAKIDIYVGAKDRLKAAELLGKRHALFTDKQQIDASVNTDKLDKILAQIDGDSDG
ncbi:terminase small subunit [Enterococcus mundtii]|uniref:terminase small subunit n=1 Tax=Enterococcus mundtii TaxID=53346 RepID=UPI0013765F0A|nr:terminase small subunit [Enterococcus mundtii]NBA61825.1 terminase small subunit [Enterococcus mundtii]